MNKIRYYKLSLTNLKGKKGRAILKEIRNTKAEPKDNLCDEAVHVSKEFWQEENNKNFFLFLKSIFII